MLGMHGRRGHKIRYGVSESITGPRTYLKVLLNRTTDTIVFSAPFVAVTPFEQHVSDYMVTAWTNFIKGSNLPI